MSSGFFFCGPAPGFGAGGERAPSADSLGQLAFRSLETVLGSYPVDSSDFWTPPDIWDAEDVATQIGDYFCVWTDGSLEPYPTAGSAVAGAGVYLPAHEFAMLVPTWEEAEVRCFYAGLWLSPDGSSGGVLGHYHGLASLLPWSFFLWLTLMWSGPLQGCSTMVACPGPYLWLRMGI